MNIFFILILSLLSLSFVSCADDATRMAETTLATAEDVMDEHPDSALTLLSDSSFRPVGKRQKALGALLLTQARHKNFIDETNDSLITTAVNYFESHDDPARLMKSLFYQATLNANATNYPSAMTIAMRADRIAKNTKDIYWQARIAELMGTILSETYFYEEAIKCYENAATLFKQVNIENAYLYNLGHLATSHENLNDYEKAIAIADSIRGQTSSPYLKVYSADILSYSLYNLERYREANAFVDTLLQYADTVRLRSLDYSNIAKIRIAYGDMSDVTKMLDKALSLAITPNDSISYNMALLRFYEKTNDIPQVYSILDTLHIQQNRIAAKIRKQSSIVAQRDFYSQQAKNAELQAAKRKYSIILIAVTSIAIIIIVTILFQNKIKRKDAEIRLKVAKIQYLTSSIDTNKSTMLQLSQSLLQKRLRQLNMLVNEFYESTDTAESRKAIYKNIEKEILKLTDKSNLGEIERIVNSCMDDIVEKMRLQLTDFSNDDIIFLTLTVAGYGAKAISLFTGIKPNSTYTKRTRLIEKIAKSDAPDKDWFISKIKGSPS